MRPIRFSRSISDADGGSPPPPWSEVRPRLEGARRVGFDLEGDFNLHRYGRRVCLFQVAIDGDVVLLDALDGVSAWDGWKEFLEDPSITKVIWAAQNDIRVLKACFGIALSGLWDLFDAACLAVTPRPTLPLLVESFLGKTIEKRIDLQTRDWSTRPLSQAQRLYAAQDVAHLLSLADRLDPLLEEKRKKTAFAARRIGGRGTTSSATYPNRGGKGSKAQGPSMKHKPDFSGSKRSGQRRGNAGPQSSILPLGGWLLPTNILFWARSGRFSDHFQVDPLMVAPGKIASTMTDSEAREQLQRTIQLLEAEVSLLSKNATSNLRPSSSAPIAAGTKRSSRSSTCTR